MSSCTHRSTGFQCEGGALPRSRPWPEINRCRVAQWLSTTVARTKPCLVESILCQGGSSFAPSIDGHRATPTAQPNDIPAMKIPRGWENLGSMLGEIRLTTGAAG